MGRLLGLILIAAVIFYAAWPGYSAYRIKTALDTNDAAALESKVDFDAVRQSLKPAVTIEAEKAMTAALAHGGADNAALIEQFKGQIMPRIIDTALTTIVTPETLLRIHREGGDLRKTLRDIVNEKLGGAGSLGALAGALGGPGGKQGALLGQLGKMAEGAGVDPGKVLGGLLRSENAVRDADAAPVAAEPAAPAAGSAKAAYGLANIKSFAINGPLGFSLGVARNAAATEPEVTADWAFTGGDWKLVGVRPRV